MNETELLLDNSGPVVSKNADKISTKMSQNVFLGNCHGFFFDNEKKLEFNVFNSDVFLWLGLD